MPRNELPIVAMTISVIIPVLQEQQRINDVIAHVRQLASGIELIVVDGDPSGATLSVISDQQVRRLTASKGRGSQLAAGCSAAMGELMVLLHADTLLPDHAFQAIQTALENGAAWGAFRLGIDATGLAYRIIERSVDLRCTLLTLPYGDQAIFVTRRALADIGGVPPLPLMEDVALAQRLAKTGHRFSLLTERVRTSPRRWQQDGILRRTLANWWLLLRYLTGTDPSRLAKDYP